MASPTDTTTSIETSSGHLREIALSFLQLGFTAFGGPAAHIAMMRDRFVSRRAWLTNARFADLLGAANLIPGPSSTELAILLGYIRGGWLGLVVGGVCFIGPAMLIVLVLAWGYVTFGHLPSTAGILTGIKPIVLAIIAQAIWQLRSVISGDRWLGIVAVLVLSGYLLGISPILLLLGAGVTMLLIRLTRQREASTASLWPTLGAPMIGSVATSAASFSQLTLFLTFLKVGAILFGSGYVLLAFLRADFVTNLHWLTDKQLFDAVSVGQFTPGPVFTTATFIGYLVGGVPGALLATLAIFLPAFVYVPIIYPIAKRLRQSPRTSAFLDGVNAAAIALMVGVIAQLGQEALRDGLSIALALVALVILLRWKINSFWLIVVGGMIGWLTYGR